MTDRYDLVVVGGGSAGITAATFAAALGRRVALVERDRVGGDCTWTGCVPSKALLHAAETAQCMRTAASVGLVAHDAPADLAAVLRGVHAARQRVYALETPQQLALRGIDVLPGEARFRDRQTLEVGGRLVRARRVLLCTGATPTVPPIPGLADGPVLTSHNVFEQTTLPEHLLVIGGGPVGVELAQAFRRLGARVTLVGRNPRLLPVADPEASELLARALSAEGVELLLGATAERVERVDGAARVRVTFRDSARELRCDQILVATGRRPNLGGLALDRAGVEIRDDRLVLDEHLRTTQHHIYAAGDAAGSYQFTHYAGWQAFLAVRNMYLPGAAQAVLSSVPWAVFTAPEVAQVGLSEAEARARGEKITVERLPIELNDRAQTAGETLGLLKIVVGRKGQIRGATLVGTAAAELINQITFAIDNHVSFTGLARTIHVYPSYSFALQLAAARALERSMTTGFYGVIVRLLARFAR